MSIKTKDLKRESTMNLHREHKSAYEIQAVVHMAFPYLGFITRHVINIHFLNVNYNAFKNFENLFRVFIM